MTGSLLHEIYTRLLAHFGPQHWWPAESPFEVMVGAILTQNTNWGNVERAIRNLKDAQLLDPHRLAMLSHAELAHLIRPAGTFNVKAKRLRNFLGFFLERYDGDVARMAAVPLATMRAELLTVQGIGPETADSILLYALGHPNFVVDAYTHRVLHRHSLAADEASYEDLQALFMDRLPADAAHFNEYHALLVAVGKRYCRPKNPQCAACPLNGVNWEGVTSVATPSIGG